MDESVRRQARAILEACRHAWRQLRGPGPAKKRVRSAAMGFSAFTKDGPLSPHVRDVYNAQTLASIEPALHTLQRLAEAFAEAEVDPPGSK